MAVNLGTSADYVSTSALARELAIKPAVAFEIFSKLELIQRNSAATRWELTKKGEEECGIYLEGSHGQYIGWPKSKISEFSQMINSFLDSSSVDDERKQGRRFANIERSLIIIEALAQGVDPYTGEIIGKESPIQQANSVRALYHSIEGLKALLNIERRKKRLPEHNGRPWSADEDRVLIEEYRTGLGFEELATMKHRTSGSIRSRLKKLGELPEK